MKFYPFVPWQKWADLLRKGLSIEVVASAIGLSIRQSRRYAIEVVQQIQQQMNAVSQS
jgi:hypothetical protein